MIPLFLRPMVAASLLAIVFVHAASLSHAECPAKSADPLVSCALPKTPCDPVGTYKQFPGVAPSGKNCGNGITTIVAGPITLNISSMQPERSGPGAVTLTNRGFGRGVTYGAWITSSTPSSYDLVDETGASTRFQRSESGTTYYPEDRVRGNLSTLTDDTVVVGGVQLPTLTLRDPRTNAKTIFTNQAGWKRYLPTLIIASDGLETVLSYDNSGVPRAIEDRRTNQRITFTSKNGYVESITNADGVVTGLEYGAGTTNKGLLTAVKQADQRKTVLTYDTAGRGFVVNVQNPNGDMQVNTYFDNGVIHTITETGGSATSVPSKTTFTYAADSVRTTSSVADSPLKFSRVVFKENPVFGMLASEVYAADGGYSDSNEGVLMSSFSYGAFGQLEAAYDKFGLGTLYFYDTKGECQSAGTNVPESPVPTCIKTQDGKTTFVYNARFLPTEITSSSTGGSSTTVKVDYEANGLPTSQRLVNARNETVGEAAISYNGKYPSSITTTSVQTASYDRLYRPTQTSSSDGSITAYEYGADGRIKGVTVDGTKLNISTHLSGAVHTTVDDGTMTTTVQTSADGLSYGVTTQRMAKDANQIAKSMGVWGGLSGDQSARAAFDISRLKRVQQDETAPARASEVAQLKASSTVEHSDSVTTVEPARGVTTTSSHRIVGTDSKLAEGVVSTQLWPRVEKAESAKKKQRRSSTVKQYIP